MNFFQFYKVFNDLKIKHALILVKALMGYAILGLAPGELDLCFLYAGV